MDNLTLKKKLSAFVSEKGYLRGVADDLLYEVLLAWENWSGPSADFYRSLGFSSSQMASLIGKAKKLKRDGAFGSQDFKALRIDSLPSSSTTSAPDVSPCHAAAEVVWRDGRVIRFAAVDHLVDFLRKSA